MDLKRNWFVGVLSLVLFLGMSACEKTPTTSEKQGEFIVKTKDGFTVKYEVAGKGDTALVFVHCWTCNRSFWDGQFAAFANNHRVVRLDLVGHGDSGKGRQHYTMASFGADVATVANDLKLQKIILVGHSMGGPVSVEAAKQLGSKVIGVVGVDTFYTGFPYPADEAAIEGFVKPFKDDFKKASSGMVRSMFPPTANPVIVDRVVNVIQNADQKMAVEAMYDIFHWTQSEAPTALDALGQRLRNINAEPVVKDTKQHAGVSRIAGVGHFVQIEKADEFNKILTGFIKEFEAGK
jgi:pimeloyl-ACP methyl ester carboxylesterase